MPDRIELRGLCVQAICGVLPQERERTQSLEFDIDVVLDLAAAGRSDALDDTVDYGMLCDRVVKVTVEGRFFLLERLAQAVADELLASDGRIDETVVAVRKLEPPVAHDLATSGVRIVRRRP